MGRYNITIGRNVIQVTHLQYADDTILFSTLEERKVVKLKIMRKLLETNTCGRSILQKSELIDMNVPARVKD